MLEEVDEGPPSWPGGMIDVTNLIFFFPRRRYFFPKVTETRLVSQSSCYSSAISPLYPNQHVMLEGDKKTS